MIALSASASGTDVNWGDTLPWRETQKEIQWERGGRGEVCPRQGGFTSQPPNPNPTAQSETDRVEQGEAAIRLEREVYMRVCMWVCVCEWWIVFDSLIDVMSKVGLGCLAMPLHISSRTDRVRWWTLTCFCSFFLRGKLFLNLRMLTCFLG